MKMIPSSVYMRFYEAFSKKRCEVFLRLSIRAVNENDSDQRLYAFLRSVFKETLRDLNFLLCVLVPERSMKMILSRVNMRFYEAFQRNTENFYIYFFCV
jgi:hypothetical protein